MLNLSTDYKYLHFGGISKILMDKLGKLGILMNFTNGYFRCVCFLTIDFFETEVHRLMVTGVGHLASEGDGTDERLFLVTDFLFGKGLFRFRPGYSLLL